MRTVMPKMRSRPILQTETNNVYAISLLGLLIKYKGPVFGQYGAHTPSKKNPKFFFNSNLLCVSGSKIDETII
jgi:hypothetical protein